MDNEIYSDGIGGITVSGSVVRIDLVSLSPTERDATNNPKPVFRQRIIMPVDVFANSAEIIQKVLRGLIDAGAVARSRPAPLQPSPIAPRGENLDGDAGIEGHVAELLPVGEQRLHAQHVLLRGGVALPFRNLGERLAHVLDGRLADAAGGSASRKRSAVLSKLRRECDEVSEAAQEATSSASDCARVARLKVPMRSGRRGMISGVMEPPFLPSQRS